MTVSIELRDKQAEVLDHLCEVYDATQDDIFNLLLLPYVFEILDIQVPLHEQKYKEYRNFIEDCLRFKYIAE